MVEFCPKCGTLILGGKKGEEIKCPKCGTVIKKGVEEKVIKEELNSNKNLEIKEEIGEVYPIVEAICPKCGHNQAFFWTKQMRSADEPESQFFKCVKCKHEWRIHKM